MANSATQITNTDAKLHSAHIIIDSITRTSYEHAQLMRGANTDEWMYSTANKFDLLTNGIMPHMPSGSDTMRYLPHNALPQGRKSTYARFVDT
jgi:hypothetical protein